MSLTSTNLWLVCGGRDYTYWEKMEKLLDSLSGLRGTPSAVIHGDARGADRLADKWARERGIQPVRCPALWGYYDKAAGYKRNVAMIDFLSPTLVVAFPGGAGTDMMIKLANDYGTEVVYCDR